jgi:hypothetical protein
MPIPSVLKESVDKEIESFCFRKFPLHVRDRVWATHRWRSDTVTIFEWRTLFDSPQKAVDIKVAQFRYDAVSRRWSLFCADRNGRWHKYDGVRPSEKFSDLLDEVDQDPTGIFWG